MQNSPEQAEVRNKTENLNNNNVVKMWRKSVMVGSCFMLYRKFIDYLTNNINI